MFGLVDYQVVTDTISLGSIPGEGVGRSEHCLGSAPVPPLSHMVVGLPNALKAGSQTEGVMVRPPIPAIQSSGL